MTEQPGLTGIVLAGGLSRRMGRDKASLPWGGEDLLHAVLRALEPVCGELIVVSNVGREIALPGVSVVPDRFTGCGPLGGIHAGLLAAAGEYSFVAACDMPGVDSRAVAFMAGIAAGFDVAVPYIGGRFNPLHAVYRRTCLPYIEAALAGGNYRISGLYEAVKVRRVAAAELAGFAADLAMLRNINTPAELKAGL